MLLRALPILFRPRPSRPLRPPALPSLPAAGLTLLSASYDHTEPALWLVFDRAVDISALNGALILVEDAEINFFQYDAQGGAELTAPATLKLSLIPIDDATGSGVRLSAPDDTGIVAADDGGAWAGATGLALPWPP